MDRKKILYEVTALTVESCGPMKAFVEGISIVVNGTEKFATP